MFDWLTDWSFLLVDWWIEWGIGWLNDGLTDELTWFAHLEDLMIAPSDSGRMKSDWMADNNSDHSH